MVGGVFSAGMMGWHWKASPNHVFLVKKMKKNGIVPFLLWNFYLFKSLSKIKK
jgi:hypothetical protein